MRKGTIAVGGRALIETQLPVVRVGDGDLGFAGVVAMARGGARAELAPAAVERMARSRTRVEAAATGNRLVYGITTGFGALEHTHVPREARVQLQHALVRSHAAGMG